MWSAGGAEDDLTAGGDACGGVWGGAGSEKSSRSIVGAAAGLGAGAGAAAAAADFVPVPAFWRGGTVLVVVAEEGEEEEVERPFVFFDDFLVADGDGDARSFSLVARLEVFFEEDLESPSPPFLLAGVCQEIEGSGGGRGRGNGECW